MRIAVVILTFNEAIHIARALDSIAPFASEIFIVDSGSTDETAAIAESKGAIVRYNPFVTQARQFQWGLDNLPLTAEWIMRLDADEIIEPDLAAEIASILPTLPAEVTGVNLKRKHIFMGRWIRHGGRYPLTLLRLWRAGTARIEQRWMDEHMVLLEGRTITLNGGFADHNLNDLTFFTDKHNKYATREALDVLNQRLNLFERDETLTGESSSLQASTKRWIKEAIYNRLPFWLSTVGYFLYRYVIQLGFLDGREGLIYHGLQGLWYRFLVGAKLIELESGIRGVEGRQAILARLSELTGHKL